LATKPSLSTLRQARSKAASGVAEAVEVVGEVVEPAPLP
jgi:hypothetical protein